MAKSEGDLWKVFTENIYRHDREERLQKAFELIVPDLAQSACEKEKKKKIPCKPANSQTEIKVKVKRTW